MTTAQVYQLADAIERMDDDQAAFAIRLLEREDPEVFGAVALAEEGVGSEGSPHTVYPDVLRRIAADREQAG